MPYERKTIDINSTEKFKNFMLLFKKTSEVADFLSKDRIPKEFLLDNHIDYISISEEDPTKVSYLTKDRVDLIKARNECLWTSQKRFHCKPGSFVSKILTNISAKSVETFSNQFKSFATKQEFRFEIVDGKKIHEYYNYAIYASQRGSLGASCMKYEKCKDYFKLYSDNPEKVKMLVMKDPRDLVLGRSLIWNFHWQGKEYKMMDRIYTIKDEDFSIFFKNWASENGYMYKKHQNWANTLQWEGSNDELHIGIEIENAKFDFYPYLDTFKWIDFEKKIIYNHLPKYFERENKNHRIICTPEGYSEMPDYLGFDEIDRCWGYKNDIIDVDGIKTSSANCIWSETMNKYILRKDSVWSEELRDNIYTDKNRMDPDLIKSRFESLNKKLPSDLLGWWKDPYIESANLLRPSHHNIEWIVPSINNQPIITAISIEPSGSMSVG